MRHVSCAMVLTVILDIVPGILGIIFGAIDFDADCSTFAGIFLIVYILFLSYETHRLIVFVILSTFQCLFTLIML